MSKYEHSPDSIKPEQSFGSEQHSKHQERLQKHHEKLAESQNNNRYEQELIRHEVHEQAILAEEYQKPQAERTQPEPRTTKADKERSFNTTMEHTRRHLSRSERRFSKFIHKPAVEKTSEILGKTIARPSGIAGSTIAAFLGLLSVYGIAKFAGFALSGSEMPLLLAIGFILGLIVEWVYKAIIAIFRPKLDQ